MEKKKLEKHSGKHILRKTLFVLTAVFVLTFVVVEGLILYHANRTSDEKADVIIILGARLYGRTPSPALSHRLDRGSAYLESHPEAIAIVSGGIGRGEEITEAAAMKTYLMEKGIDERRILTEEGSFNTYENITFSIAMLEKEMPTLKLEETKFGIVTSSFHVFRGTLTARENGLDAFGIPSTTPPTTLVKGYLREYLSVLKYLIIDRNR
ncbi:YdcF family protein [Proteiniclasticum sp. C24MP]|uniref:YdcF family protein n=1 Tax=Proteiniclasticum sp. C24MP TaxID=3374101 RepID=UPI003754BE65